MSGGRLAHSQGWVELELAIRDLARAMLYRSMFEFGPEVIEEVWIVVSDVIPYGTPNPTQIIEELGRLIEFETRPSLLRHTERENRYPVGSFQFAKDTIGT